VHSQIDIAINQGPLDFAREQSFSTGSEISNRCLRVIAPSADDFCFYFEIGPAAAQFIDDHLRLSAGKFAATRSDPDCFSIRHHVCFCSGGL
jgi:hypothetical protein